MFLDKELKKLEQLFPYLESHNGDVSEKGVGWHIDHTLRSIIAISDTLAQSDPADYSWKFNITRLFVHTTGYIPRGKGKAPEASQSFGAIKQEDLTTQLKTSKNKLKMLYELPSKSNFKHPYFGMLNLKQSKRFLVVHTRHHLKIIRDILG